MTSDPRTAAILSVDELVAMILAGQPQLYGEIVRRYQRDVLRVVTRLLYGPRPTEDLVQEVFLAAYAALDRFRPGCDFGPWIRSIARNAVREELRRQSRYDRRLKAYGDRLRERLEQESAEPEEEELHHQLADCIGRLPERQATAVRLRYDEERPLDEIAVELAITGPAVRNLLCHARASLRECLERKAQRP